MNKSFILIVSLWLSSLSQAAIDKKQLRFFKPRSILVAVIDTGVDCDHPDLKNNIWTNPGESGLDIYGKSKTNNNIDDDLNGFIDDIHGWNFIDNNNDLSDANGHGTHIAGIIKTEFIKEDQRRKKNSDVQLMVLKYYSSSAQQVDNIKFSTQAIRYANKMRARVINYSGGGPEPSRSELIAIQESRNLKILFVAAAGNNKSNTDSKKYFPASYLLDNIVSVAASNKLGELVPFSNFGPESVDIAALGEAVLSTLPNNRYGMMSGTSQATAIISGRAAHVLIQDSQIQNPQAVLKRLLKSSKHIQNLQGKTKYQMALLSDD